MVVIKTDRILFAAKGDSSEIPASGPAFRVLPAVIHVHVSVRDPALVYFRGFAVSVLAVEVSLADIYRLDILILDRGFKLFCGQK